MKKKLNFSRSVLVFTFLQVPALRYVVLFSYDKEATLIAFKPTPFIRDST